MTFWWMGDGVKMPEILFSPEIDPVCQTMATRKVLYLLLFLSLGLLGGYCFPARYGAAQVHHFGSGLGLTQSNFPLLSLSIAQETQRKGGGAFFLWIFLFFH